MKHNENRKPTPETDKMAFKIGNTEVVTVKFARKLERRLIQANVQLARINQAINVIPKLFNQPPSPAPVPPAVTPCKVAVVFDVSTYPYLQP